jgi:hypothetical protein
MANTVISAFNEFLLNFVNLDSELTKDARKSKDWLIEQIHNFPENDTDFPRLYQDCGYSIRFIRSENKEATT